MKEILIFFVMHWYASLFFQTFMLHRYAAHGMLTMSKNWERFFIFLTYIAQGSSYLTPRAYGILHRMHHANADTAEDVHSPSHILKGKPLEKAWGWICMFVETAKIYDKIDKGEKVFTVNVVRARVIQVTQVLEKNLPYYPVWDRVMQSPLSRIAWGLIYINVYVTFAPSYWWYLLLPIHFFMGPIHGVIINWYTHLFGYRNYTTSDTSTNLLIPMLGENLHNNHHGESGNANFARKWWEIDLTYQLLRVFNFLGMIKFNR